MRHFTSVASLCLALMFACGLAAAAGAPVSKPRTTKPAAHKGTQVDLALLAQCMASKDAARQVRELDAAVAAQRARAPAAGQVSEADRNALAMLANGAKLPADAKVSLAISDFGVAGSFSGSQGVVAVTSDVLDGRARLARDEVAAMFARELAHIAARDTLRDACEEYALVGESALSIAQAKARISKRVLAGDNALASLLLARSRDRQAAATKAGGQLLARAGFDARAMQRLDAKLTALDQAVAAPAKP